MAEEHVKAIRAAREQMTGARRRLAETFSHPLDPLELSEKAKLFFQLQQGIEAMDRAISDEDAHVQMGFHGTD